GLLSFTQLYGLYRIRKWVLRLYINNARTYFVINDEEKTTIEIVDVIDIFNHADKIIPVVERYL
ncbi:hypothetical protein G7493_003403, partial [Listeria monocytogenes]|nr:hypothetical protein [Listeria monocytogenes]